jgi:hypothetical protein
MLPMYNVVKSGTGTKKNIIHSLETRVKGPPRLFIVLKELFLHSINSLLEETAAKLQAATDKCCEDIGNDLELLRGEEVPVAEEDGVIERMFEILEQSRAGRDEAARVFEAGLVEP